MPKQIAEQLMPIVKSRILDFSEGRIENCLTVPKEILERIEELQSQKEKKSTKSEVVELPRKSSETSAEKEVS